MSLWRKTRGEVAGAYRSLRYDLGKPDPERAGPAPGAYGADVTSTGMSTFGGVPLGAASADPIRPPRRVLAATTFAVLAVAGAAGSYFAVVNGLGALLGVDSRPDPFPLAATAPDGADANTGLGSVEAQRAAGVRPVTAGTVTVTAVPGAAAGGTLPPAAVPGAPAAVATTAPGRRTTAPDRGGAPKPGESPCDCPAPPVPTPTDAGNPGEPAPGEPSEPGLPSPTATPSPAPSPSLSPDQAGGAPGDPAPAVTESAPSRRARHRHR